MVRLSTDFPRVSGPSEVPVFLAPDPALERRFEVAGDWQHALTDDVRATMLQEFTDWPTVAPG